MCRVGTAFASSRRAMVGISRTVELDAPAVECVLARTSVSTVSMTSAGTGSRKATRRPLFSTGHRVPDVRDEVMPVGPALPFTRRCQSLIQTWASPGEQLLGEIPHRCSRRESVCADHRTRDDDSRGRRRSHGNLSRTAIAVPGGIDSPEGRCGQRLPRHEVHRSDRHAAVALERPPFPAVVGMMRAASWTLVESGAAPPATTHSTRARPLPGARSSGHPFGRGACAGDRCQSPSVTPVAVVRFRRAEDLHRPTGVVGTDLIADLLLDLGRARRPRTRRRPSAERCPPGRNRSRSERRLAELRRLRTRGTRSPFRSERSSISWRSTNHPPPTAQRRWMIGSPDGAEHVVSVAVVEGGAESPALDQVPGHVPRVATMGLPAATASRNTPEVRVLKIVASIGQ